MRLLQLAAQAGAIVTATVRNPERRDAVAALGADVVLAPGDEAAHAPYDVVLELVGAPSLTSVLAHVALWGRVVVIGTGAGSRCELDMSRLMSRRAKVMGSTLRARPLEDKALVTIAVQHHVLPFVDQGRVKVVVEAAFPFEQAQEAYERFAVGGKFGKIVLTRS